MSSDWSWMLEGLNVSDTVGYSDQRSRRVHFSAEKEILTVTVTPSDAWDVSETRSFRLTEVRQEWVDC